MPRPPRVVLPEQPLHLIQRGNNRAPVFVDAGEFVLYKDLVHEASESARCALHAYVLMTNHVHLLVTPRDTVGPGRLMKRVSHAYARWFNRRHRRSGTLWEGRFRSAAIDTENYLLVCSRYIELNPVRARMVEKPEDYQWSSFRSNAHGLEDPLLTPHPRYEALGGSKWERQASYRALFNEPFDDTLLAALRRGVHTRTLAGPAAFVASVEREQERRLPPMAQGGDRRSTSFRDGSISGSRSH